MSSGKVLVKICGLTEPGEAEVLARYGADLAGMVLFFPKSKRNISLEQAKGIMAVLDHGIRSVAVTVSPTLAQVALIRKAGFDRIQIHGELRPEVLAAAGLPIIRALSVEQEGFKEACDRLDGDPRVEAFLFDAAKPGSGRTFDWSRMDKVSRCGKPFFLAGGLNPDNVAEAIRYLRPDGVDVSSGVEYGAARGKDPEKVKAFIKAARTAGDGRW